MKGSRIVILLFVLLLVAVVAFLLLRSRPSPMTASPSQPAAQAPTAPAAPPAPPQPVDLGAALGLDSLADCGRSPALAAIVDQMVRIDPDSFESSRGGPIEVAGYDRPIVPTFERVREIEGNTDIRAVTADLDLPGRWHGLAVTGLRRSFHEESDSASLEIRFAEPAERVRETLARHGFTLPPVGELREVEEEGLSVVIGVERIEGGAALTCAT
jgi:hypothetical protein